MKNKKDTKDTKAQNKAKSAAKEFVTESTFNSDPLGSYTGNPADNEVPTQDADDI